MHVTCLNCNCLDKKCPWQNHSIRLTRAKRGLRMVHCHWYSHWMTETKAGWMEAVGLAGSVYKPLLFLFILILALFSVYRVTDCSLYFNECFLGFVFVCGFFKFFFNLKLFDLLCGNCKTNISISKPWLSQGHRKSWSCYHRFLTSCIHFMFCSIDANLAGTPIRATEAPAPQIGQVMNVPQCGRTDWRLWA